MWKFYIYIYIHQIVNSVFNNSISAISPNGPEVLSSLFNKVKLIPENFSKKFNRDDTSTAFPSRTNLKMHNICVNPKLIKMIIISRLRGKNYIVKNEIWIVSLESRHMNSNPVKSIKNEEKLMMAIIIIAIKTVYNINNNNE